VSVLTPPLSCLCKEESLAFSRMRPPNAATLAHFQQEVAKLLELPAGSGDAEVRCALRAKGPDFVAWYDTRLQAILESNLSPARANAPFGAAGRSTSLSSC
jgi:hypothetical protein